MLLKQMEQRPCRLAAGIVLTWGEEVGARGWLGVVWSRKEPVSGRLGVSQGMQAVIAASACKRHQLLRDGALSRDEFASNYNGALIVRSALQLPEHGIKARRNFRRESREPGCEFFSLPPGRL